MRSLKYVDVCLSCEVKRVSALCDSGTEICVANSSVMEGLNLDPIGQIQLRQFYGNTVKADLVCLNVSLVDSDVPNVTPNQVLKVTCAVVSDLYDTFISISGYQRGIGSPKGVCNRRQWTRECPDAR